MASIAMLVGGTLVNAVAFSGSNYLFSMFQDNEAGEERAQPDKAIEKLQTAQAAWSHKWTERLNWINEELHHQDHALRTFQDVDAAIREYARVTGNNLNTLGPEPQEEDFYTPSADQKGCEVAFVIDVPGSLQTRTAAVLSAVVTEKKKQ